jgi:hypothetical protein
MKRSIFWSVAVLLSLGGGWGGYAVYRAHRNLVTLDVRDVDLRAVVRRLEWQTWENIIVHRDVDGKITMSVRDAPLARVMGILAEQTDSRWTTVYPLYSSRKSLVVLRGMAAGDSGAGTNGWSAFRSRPPQMGRGMFAANANAENDRVTIKIVNQDLETVSLALARYAPAQVVPEDGTSARVDLALTEAPMSHAVAQLAVKVDRSWTRFYTLQPGFRFNAARRGPLPDDELPAGPEPGPNTDGGTNQVVADRGRPEPSREEQIRREQQYQALLETMSPEERQQAEQRRQRWQEMRNLTPEQRRARFAQTASDPAVQQRMQQRALQRLLNSTPDQRVARDRRAVARITGHAPPPTSNPPAGQPPIGQPPPARP